MKQKTALTILYTVLAVILLLLVLQVIQDGKLESRVVMRAIVSLGLCGSGIYKVTRQKAGSTQAYEQQYKDILCTAFTQEGRKPLRRKLLQAITLYNQNRMTDSIKKLEALLPQCKTSDDHCAVLMFLALNYTDLKLTDKAIATYDKLLSLDNTRSTAWSNLGLLYKKEGNNLQSITCYENAVRYDDKNPYAYNNMAAAYYSMGSYQKAVDAAKKALDLKNNMYQASNTLCLAYACLGDSEESEKYFTLSVANGADAQGLKKAVSACLVGGHLDAAEDIHSPQIARAIRDFTRQTGRSFVHAGIPYSKNRSHFGGPAIGTAPTDSQGNPMRLLCALYCSEIKNVPDLPASGLLLFYIADNHQYGLDITDPTNQKDWRIVYSEDEALPESPVAPAQSPTFPILGRWPIEFYPDVCSMSHTDFRFQDTMDACLKANGAPCLDELDEDTKDSIYAHFNCEGHRVGGYTHFNQYDPRERKELQKYDTLLLQIATHFSDQGDFVSIGHMGAINFFISREALQRKDFSDVLYHWDFE